MNCLEYNCLVFFVFFLKKKHSLKNPPLSQNKVPFLAGSEERVFFAGTCKHRAKYTVMFSGINRHFRKINE